MKTLPPDLASPSATVSAADPCADPQNAASGYCRERQWLASSGRFESVAEWNARRAAELEAGAPARSGNTGSSASAPDGALRVTVRGPRPWGPWLAIGVGVAVGLFFYALFGGDDDEG